MDGDDTIPGRLRTQLEALDLAIGRPLLVVDCDEVLVHLAEHLERYVAGLGYEMRLTAYRLEGAIRRDGTAIAFEDSIRLIERFFDEETARQRPVEGAVAALERLSRRAQVVVLTNVPKAAHGARIANLEALGMAYPVIENGGGKGRALAWLAERVQAPVAFVDDSPEQIASAAAHAPQVARVHFAGVAYVADLVPEIAGTPRARSWAEAEALLARALAGGE